MTARSTNSMQKFRALMAAQGQTEVKAYLPPEIVKYIDRRKRLTGHSTRAAVLADIIREEMQRHPIDPPK